MKVSEINNLLELFFERYKLQDKNSIFLTPLNNNQRSFTWEETKNNILKLSKEISDINQKGDRCLLISENRPEWQITDLAIMSIGAISVPAYTTSTTNDYKYIIEHSGARCAIVSSHELMKKVLPAIEKISHCQNVIKINDDNETYTEVVNILSYNKIINDNLEKSKNSNEIEELSKNYKRSARGIRI